MKAEERCGSKSRERGILSVLCGLPTPERCRQEPELRLAWKVIQRSLQDLYDPNLPVILRFDAWAFLSFDEFWSELLGINIRGIFTKYPFPPFVISMEEVRKWEKEFCATTQNVNDTERTRK